VLKRIATFLVALGLLGACGQTGYADIPVEREVTRATAAQQERYGVSADTRVLLELLPSSYKHETGPSGGFHYQPYELVFDCKGYLQVQEHHEYRKFLRPQAQGNAEAAYCPSGRRGSGLRKEPKRGDDVWIGVVDSENDNWGVLVVATDKPT
jgi:hypothetical protein